jgi:hypothetical protein
MTNLSQRHVLVPTLAALLGLALTCSGASADAQQTSTAESRDTDDGPADSASKAKMLLALRDLRKGFVEGIERAARPAVCVQDAASFTLAH